MLERCKNVLWSHFRGDFLAAFAYGSGVFRQQSRHAPGMLDFLLLVDDNDWLDWHIRNRMRNPRDYPASTSITLSLFGPGSIFFVPSVRVRTQNGNGTEQIKYGVVRFNDLRQDLLLWSQLYLAGRLQKPTLFIPNSDGLLPTVLTGAMKRNYASALSVALLQLSYNDSQLAADFKTVLHRIVGLSYCGDPRPEAPDKVRSIVEGQFRELEAIYLTGYEQLRKDLLGLDAVEQRRLLLSSSPANFLARLWNTRRHSTLDQVAVHSSLSDVDEAVRSIVRWPAWRQMLLGAFSCPPSVALKYSLSKLQKRFQS